MAQSKIFTSESVKDTAFILRDIVTIIMALAFTGAIVAVLTTNGSTPIDLWNISQTKLLSFVCVMTTIVRFYHGNISYLNNTYSVSDAEASVRGLRYKLACDFVIFLMQSMIFCALAIYQPNIRDFYSLFVILFGIDALWCLANVWFSKMTFRGHEASKAHDHLRSQMNWMLANFAAGILLGIILLRHWNDTPEQLNIIVPFMFFVIIGNTVVDYWLNRRFYFPVGVSKRKKKCVFVGARFTSAITETGFDPNLRGMIECVHDRARSYHFTVLSAHEEEDFGNKIEKPELFVPRDLEQIADSDVFIALCDEKISPGLMIELGWASILGKKIILLMPNTQLSQNPMMKGLSEITDCELLRYDGNIQSLQQVVNESLKKIA